MRCTSFSTASAYDLSRLNQALQTFGTTQLFRNVLHLQYKQEKGVKGDIFFFSYGTVVFWGFTIQEEQDQLKILKDYEKESIGKTEIDEFTFAFGPQMKIEEDQIILPNKNILTKLALSHAIAQSVKLTTFEEVIQKTIGLTANLPIDLARKGKIGLSRRVIYRKMGEIFLERSSINLHSEILDTPEFFWDHPKLEAIYRKMVHYLEVARRADLLNKRLNVLHELFEILSDELKHQHSSRLEWTIIILIVFEVAIALIHDIFHII
jgi:uncharacterized Rmd1/YagE family protein